LAAAIGLEAGEEVQWELLDRGELHLVETNCHQFKPLRGPPNPQRSRCRPKNRLLKATGAVHLTEVTHDRPVSEN
jgi:hypothetical protein